MQRHRMERKVACIKFATACALCFLACADSDDSSWTDFRPDGEAFVPLLPYTMHRKVVCGRGLLYTLLVSGWGRRRSAPSCSLRCTSDQMRCIASVESRWVQPRLDGRRCGSRDEPAEVPGQHTAARRIRRCAREPRDQGRCRVVSCHIVTEFFIDFNHRYFPNIAIRNAVIRLRNVQEDDKNARVISSRLTRRS